jgi:hypothetical protein
METIFVDGLQIYPPHENAPEFVRGSLVVLNAEQLIDFIKRYQDDKGQIRIDINKAKSGKLYLKLNTYNNHKLSPTVSVEPQQPAPTPTTGAYSAKIAERKAQSQVEPTVDDLADVPF